MNSSSTSTASLLQHTSKRPNENAGATRKDYSAAFSDLQAQYGVGGSAPILPSTYFHPDTSPAPSSAPPTTIKKWVRWPTSNPSLATPSSGTHPSPARQENSSGTLTGAARKEYESALWNLTDTYGGPGPALGPEGLSECIATMWSRGGEMIPDQHHRMRLGPLKELDAYGSPWCGGVEPGQMKSLQLRPLQEGTGFYVF
ncbi:hypothetical protein EDD15DRAFT_2196757 [Pisolithus albus]|nr:hypothetical protein EDD15DRAFT_2196757 [Pisolithus albus]